MSVPKPLSSLGNELEAPSRGESDKERCWCLLLILLVNCRSGTHSSVLLALRLLLAVPCAQHASVAPVRGMNFTVLQLLPGFTSPAGLWWGPQMRCGFPLRVEASRVERKSMYNFSPGKQKSLRCQCLERKGRSVFSAGAFDGLGSFLRSA